jgi:hypothetical protein
MRQISNFSFLVTNLILLICVGCKPNPVDDRSDSLIVYQDLTRGVKLVFEPAKENMWSTCSSNDPSDLQPCHDIVQAMSKCDIPNGRGMCSDDMETGEKILDYAVSASDGIFGSYLQQKISRQPQIVDGRPCIITRVEHQSPLFIETTFCEETCVKEIKYFSRKNGIEINKMTLHLRSRKGILCKNGDM